LEDVLEDALIVVKTEFTTAYHAKNALLKYKKTELVPFVANQLLY
jgi:hypothetical protein